MNDGVIVRPQRSHSCAPGVTYRWSDGDPIWGLNAVRYAEIPSQYTHPAGTVWQCECGKTWVSKPPRWVNAPGDVSWRREHWWERRRRQRAGVLTESAAWEAEKRAGRIADLERELGIGEQAG